MAVTVAFPTDGLGSALALVDATPQVTGPWPGAPPGRSRRMPSAWEERYASYAAHACGKGLVCANSPTCAGEGHGCDPTVLNNADTNDHPDACGSYYGPIDSSFMLSFYAYHPPHSKQCGRFDLWCMGKKLLKVCEGKLLVGGAAMVGLGLVPVAGGAYLADSLGSTALASGSAEGLELLHGALDGGVVSAGGGILQSFGGMAIIDACSR